MTEFRYRAYISYSHKDEVWASWLHRSLEAYRIPRNLVGSINNVGRVPARIRPVFRDRDDLSSVADLGDTVKQALSDSENLIVICSPEAAASHWVNEEIRHFAHLGRADRIFCIIVNGEPADDGSVAALFPAALAEIGMQEPLAADVRKWADGKNTAKLKLIAGMLGIRLDELRQRDLQRHRKRQAIVGLGVVAAVSLIVVTLVAQISEQQEREKTEQLATFIVDLGERLQSDADLETLALISTEASKHLQSMDLDKLSPATGEKVALALRQMGNVSQGQGRPVEALVAFERSRDLFSRLAKKYPEKQELLFQLGNAEYFIGNLHAEQDHYESALKAMKNYQSLTRQLFDMDPENPDWIMELSYSYNNIAALQLESGSGIGESTFQYIAEAVRLMEKVVRLRPEDKSVADSYATTLAWAADAQAQACNLEDAMAVREKVMVLAEDSARSNPGNNDLSRRYAYSLAGVAKVQTQLGQLDLAEQNLRKAISILQQLAAADPSNVNLRGETANRKVLLAKMLHDSGQPETAKATTQELKPEMKSTGVFTNQAGPSLGGFIDYLIVFADIELHSGNAATANSYLKQAKDLQKNKAVPQQRDKFDRVQHQKMRYQWWEGSGEDGLANFAIPGGLGRHVAGEFQSCIESDYEARMYLLENDRETAAGLVKYLGDQGYADPGFKRFCVKYKLCSEER